MRGRGVLCFTLFESRIGTENALSTAGKRVSGGGRRATVTCGPDQIQARVETGEYDGCHFRTQYRLFRVKQTCF